STADEARFTIQNMAKLALRVSAREKDRKIIAVPSEEAPFALELKWDLESKDNGTEARYTISADLNMMMKMLASGPLQKRADHETKTVRNSIEQRSQPA